MAVQSLDQVDTDWAWQLFRPTPQSPWNLRAAAHLHRRAGFGAPGTLLQESLDSEPAEAVHRLVAAAGEPSDFRATADALTRTIVAGGDPRKLSAAWCYRLLFTPTPLLEKSTLFWHGHFATGAEKVQDAEMMWNQNQLLRDHALGDFAQMTQEIARDPAMLIYLDSAVNRKAHPNENFARELMELFCLGEGNYSERDVQELARCFTGWEIKRGRFRKNRYQQDTGSKSFLGESGIFDGEDGVRIVLEQPAMSRFIARKLVRFFVCDEPTVPDRLLQPLADAFVASELDIAVLVEKILSSNLFFSEHSVARKIRSPVDASVGLLRSLEGTTNTLLLAEEMRKTGQGLFYPPNVKGWDGGRSWINSSTLLGRANMMQRVLSHEATVFAGGRLVDYFSARGLEQDDEIIDWLDKTLLALPLAPPEREQLLEPISRGQGEREQQLRRLLHAFTSMPQYHLA